MHPTLRHLAAVAVLLVLPSPIHAQQSRQPAAGVGPCGPLDDPFRQLRLEHYTGVFTDTDEEAAEFRASLGLNLAGPDGPMEVVSQPRVCGPIVAEAFRVLNKRIVTKGSPATRADTEWVVLRIGPYWVIPMQPLQVEGVTVQGYGQVLIFTASDSRFVAWFLG